MVKVTYIFHDCFIVNTTEVNMIFDFWLLPERLGEINTLIDTSKPLYVFVSHHHKDHLNRDIFSWSEDFPNIHYIISRDVYKACRHHLDKNSLFKGKKIDMGQFTVLRPGEIFSDKHIWVRAFGSTDEGDSFYLKAGDKTFFHAGDLNAWLWKDESTDQEIEEALGSFNKIINDIATVTDSIDFCFWPVDARIGTDYFEGAKIVTRIFDISHFFPMHFELGENQEDLDRLHDAAKNFERYANLERGEYIALLHPGDMALFTV